MRSSPLPGLRGVAAAALLAAGTTLATASPLPATVAAQFSFGDAGSLAAGCDPEDPTGGFCVPSSVTPSVFLGTPAWTFLSGDAGSTLQVIDVFEATERFEVFDFGVLVGTTSALVPTNVPVDCGDDVNLCAVTPGMSFGAFQFGPGAHEITLRALQANGPGTAYLLLRPNENAVPEPASALLLLAALGAARVARRQGVAS